MFTEWSVPAILTSSPASLTSLTCGRDDRLARRGVLGSMTTRVDRPVTSSICLATVTPSSMFSKRTAPAYSDDDGTGQRVPGGQARAGLDGFAVAFTSTVAP